MLVKEKRLEYQRGLEEYIEEQKLYEMFEGMMKGLIIDKPADPINYLIEKL
jgi:adenylate kinase